MVQESLPVVSYGQSCWEGVIVPENDDKQAAQPEPKEPPPNTDWAKTEEVRKGNYPPVERKGR